MGAVGWFGRKEELAHRSETGPRYMSQHPYDAMPPTLPPRLASSNTTAPLSDAFKISTSNDVIGSPFIAKERTYVALGISRGSRHASVSQPKQEHYV